MTRYVSPSPHRACRIGRRAARLLAVAALLAGGAAPVAAQTYQVGLPVPPYNAVSVPLNTNTDIDTYFGITPALDPATVGNIRLFGNLRRGRRVATITSSGGNINIDPLQDLLPNERLDITYPPTVLSATGDAPNTPLVYTLRGRAGVASGVFYNRPDVPAGISPADVVTGDIDNDGNLDLLTANYSSGSISVARGNGDATFGTPTDVLVGSGIGSGVTSVILTDLDADQDLDLAAVNLLDATLNALRNDGAGNFSAVGGFPISLGAGGHRAVAGGGRRRGHRRRPRPGGVVPQHRRGAGVS